MIPSFKIRANTITVHAWETWTKNGLNLLIDDRELTAHVVKVVVFKSYRAWMSDADWLAATLKHLGRIELNSVRA